MLSIPPPLFLGGLLWLWMVVGRLLPALELSRGPFKRRFARADPKAPAPEILVEIERKKIA